MYTVLWTHLWLDSSIDRNTTSNPMIIDKPAIYAWKMGKIYEVFWNCISNFKLNPRNENIWRFTFSFWWHRDNCEYASFKSQPNSLEQIVRKQRRFYQVYFHEFGFLYAQRTSKWNSILFVCVNTEGVLIHKGELFTSSTHKICSVIGFCILDLSHRHERKKKPVRLLCLPVLWMSIARMHTCVSKAP